MIHVRPTLVALIVLSSISIVRADETPLRQTAVIPLGEVKGRIDHLALDRSGGRLFVAALGNNSVEVIDLATSKVVNHLAGVSEPQGVCFLSETRMLVVASGADGKCRFYGPALEPVSTLDNLDDADNVRLHVPTGQVVIGWDDGALAICDAGKLTGQVKLAGHPESFQLESRGPRVFVNVPTARHVVVVDREQKRVLATWPVTDAEANFPMALDEVNHRLFIVCRKPAKLLVLDTESGKIVSQCDVCGDADDIWLDADAHRIYITGGEGKISVIDQRSADEYRPLVSLPTAPGARTSLFDPESRRLFVAVPKRDGQNAEIRVYQPAKAK